MNKTTEQFSRDLREVGLKVTRARLRLLQALSVAKHPISVEKIYQSLGKLKPDMATVYRALKDLQLSGLIKQIDFQHGHAHYEYAKDVDHHHLICTKCNRVEDIENCDIDPLISKTLKRSKYFDSQQYHNFEIFGVCKKCQKK